jgi:hypothetical protein
VPARAAAGPEGHPVAPDEPTTPAEGERTAENEPGPTADGDRTLQNEPTVAGGIAAPAVPALAFALVILLLARLAAAFAGAFEDPAGRPQATAGASGGYGDGVGQIQDEPGPAEGDRIPQNKPSLAAEAIDQLDSKVIQHPDRCQAFVFVDGQSHEFGGHGMFSLRRPRARFIVRPSPHRVESDRATTR